MQGVFQCIHDMLLRDGTVDPSQASLSDFVSDKRQVLAVHEVPVVPGHGHQERCAAAADPDPAIAAEPGDAGTGVWSFSLAELLSASVTLLRDNPVPQHMPKGAIS